MAIVACQDLARQRNKQYAAGEQRRQSHGERRTSGRYPSPGTTPPLRKSWNVHESPFLNHIIGCFSLAQDAVEEQEGPGIHAAAQLRVAPYRCAATKASTVDQ